MAIGVLLGSLLFLKIIQFLLNHFYTQTFYAIIGFVLGSVLILYPGFNLSIEGFISIGLFILSFYVGLKFEKISR